jgi:hypothetical protein
MTIPHLVGLRHRGLCVVALVLCICVIMQMLGASVTSLSAGDISDEMSGSVREEFSVPPTRYQPAVFSESTLVVEILPFVNVWSFVSARFHPSVR